MSETGRQLYVVYLVTKDVSAEGMGVALRTILQGTVVAVPGAITKTALDTLRSVLEESAGGPCVIVSWQALDDEPQERMKLD